jgi:hypothetical protein
MGTLLSDVIKPLAAEVTVPIVGPAPSQGTVSVPPVSKVCQPQPRRFSPMINFAIRSKSIPKAGYALYALIFSTFPLSALTPGVFANCVPFVPFRDPKIVLPRHLMSRLLHHQHWLLPTLLLPSPLSNMFPLIMKSIEIVCVLVTPLHHTF